MNLNFPADLKFLERVTAPFFITATWASMARIVIWVVVFLIAAHLFAPNTTPQLPFTAEMMEQDLTPLASTPSDPRYMRLDKKTVEDNSIIWVGGSSLAIKEDGQEDYTFLPSQVKTDHNQYIAIKMGSRLLDTYTMTLDAIERQPDVLFVALNPFWILNDNAFFFKTNVFNAGASLWANHKDWQLNMLLSSPGNMLWSVAGKHHKVIGNSYDFLKLLVPKSMKVKKTVQPKEIEPLQGRQKVTNETIEIEATVSYKKPIVFWTDKRFETHKETRFGDPTIWQEKIMAYQNAETSHLGQNILKNLFYHVKKSNIPTLIYLAPTDYSFTKTPALDAYRNVQKHVNIIADDYQSDNINLVRIPQWVYSSIEFSDYLHLKNSGNLPDFLGAQISATIQKHEYLEKNENETKY